MTKLRTSSSGPSYCTSQCSG